MLAVANEDSGRVNWFKFESTAGQLIPAVDSIEISGPVPTLWAPA